jgi:alcohol dehydrogenase (cytochrome c)
VLFKRDTGGAIAGGVISYRIGGTQYVAVTSGNVSRFLWGETGLPSVAIFRVGANAATTSSQSVAASPAPRIGETDVGHGHEVYARTCSACHGAAGEGLTGPALKAVAQRLSLQELSAWIMNPVARRDASGGLAMPRLYPSALADQDVFDVAAFVKTF